MTANSALKQNWVGCTVRTPRTQVARTLCAQCSGRGRCCTHNGLVARMSRAQPAQVARSACAGRTLSAQVVGASRDLPSAQPKPPRSRPQNRVATPISIWHPEPCRDIKSVRPENFQFLEKGQNCNFDYKIVISVKNPEFIL